MPAAFAREEYQSRLKKVRDNMSERDLDAMLIGDPANMNWLTGFDAWSFYVPQVMLVLHDHDPIWMGRKMDAGAVSLTTYLPQTSIKPYAEDYVQRAGVHPMEIVAGYLCDLSLQGKRIGYESDTYFFSPRSLDCLQRGVDGVQWVDADLLVNWCRVIKSSAEIEVMRQAARLVENAMTVAYETIAPGVRQCDLMSKIVAAQVGGNEQFGGDDIDPVRRSIDSEAFTVSSGTRRQVSADSRHSALVRCYYNLDRVRPRPHQADTNQSQGKPPQNAHQQH